MRRSVSAHLTWAVPFFVSLAVYVATCARTITLVDSGALVVAAACLGVAHAPGFPLYLMLGHLFSLLPLGTMAFRLTLMSVFFSSVTAAFVALAVREMLLGDSQGRGNGMGREKTGKGRKEKRKGKKRDESPIREAVGDTTWLQILVPPSAGLLWAFAITPWLYATLVEVYALHLALLSGCLWLVLRWRRLQPAREASVYLVFAGLLLGLSVAVHHVTAILFAPGLVWLVLASAGFQQLYRRETLWAILAALSGLLCYAYLPMAAAREPLWNWGDPSSWKSFWWHVSAGDYRSYVLAGEAERAGQRLSRFVELAVRQWTWLGLPLVALGIIRWWQRHRPLVGLLLLTTLATLSYVAVYDIAEDRDAYFLTIFLILTVALAAGSLQLAELRFRGTKGLATVLALLLPATSLLAHFQESNRRDDRVAEHFVTDMLQGVGTGGLVLTRDWQFYAPFLYYHHLEGVRPDVHVLDINLMRLPWYLEGYLGRVYPELLAGLERQRDSLLRAFRRAHKDPSRKADAERQLVAFLNTLIADRESHISIPPLPGVGGDRQWVPNGLTYRLHQERGRPPAPLPELHLDPFLEEAPNLEVAAQTKVRPTYAFMLAARGQYLGSLGQFDNAQVALDLAKQVDPDFHIPFQMAGDVAAMQGRIDLARESYRHALELNPRDELSRKKLAELGRK